MGTITLPTRHFLCLQIHNSSSLPVRHSRSLPIRHSRMLLAGIQFFIISTICWLKPDISSFLQAAGPSFPHAFGGNPALSHTHKLFGKNQTTAPQTAPMGYLFHTDNFCNG